MSTKTTKAKRTKKKGRRKSTKGRRQHTKLHRCNPKCHHVCGDAGGLTNRGKPCGRPGGQGVNGVALWSLAQCRRHAENAGNGRLSEEELDGLTGLRARFVLQYCGPANCCGTKASRAAGFSPNGTEETHQANASRLLKDPKVKAAILRRFNELSAPGEEIMRRMTADARLSVEDLVQFDDKGVASIQLTPETLAIYGTLIKEFELDGKGKVVKIKLNDSQTARRDLARALQLFSDAPTINIFNLQDLPDDEVTARLNAARDRLALRHYHGDGAEGDR